MARVNRTDRQAAEQLAIQALAFLAGDAEQLGRFLALTGLGPETIRAAATARDSQFLAGVLDHIAGDDGLLTAFAEHVEVAPDRVMQARAVLAGQAWERETP